MRPFISSADARVGGRTGRGSGLAAVLACLVCAAGGTVFSDVLRSQSIVLTPGWNAVYLEVDPGPSDPEQLFSGLPIDIVAAYDAPDKGAQFVRNPSADMLGAYGWAVWYAPSRPDAFLSTLYGIYGAKPYLVHATTNTTLQVSGTLVAKRMTWAPNAFNFVGFSVAEPGAPTFRQFFRGSAAHDHNRIYRLVDGTWRQVLNPDSALMKAGEAFWIFCEGRSDYPGPLEVSTKLEAGLNLSSRSGGTIVFRNRADHPVSFSMEHVVDPAQPIPLSTPIETYDEEAGGLRTLSVHFDAASFVQDFPPLEEGAAIRLPLALRAQDAGPGVRHSLLKVTTDIGTISYVPVTATRDDL